MIKAIASAFKNGLNFSGRATRLQYWSFVIFAFCFIVLTHTTFYIFMNTFFTVGSPASKRYSQIFIWIVLGLVLISLFLLFSLSVRRSHDVNIRAWWLALIPLSPLILYLTALLGGGDFFLLLGYPCALISGGVLICLLIISLWPGTKGDNRFGSPP